MGVRPGRRHLKVSRPDQRLTEIHGTFNHSNQRQEVAMPIEPVGHRRPIAARRPVLANEAVLHMRRASDQRISVPGAGGKPAARMLRILRRMESTVHPDVERQLVVPRPDRESDDASKG
jgi:hypothetical protein